jgi:uncharacterized membrane protein YqjE
MIEDPDTDRHHGSSIGESAVEFVSARLELLSLEAQEAGKAAAKKGALVALIVGCAVMAWMAFVAGLIGWIATAGDGVKWYFVAIGAAVFHLLLAGIAAALLRKPSAASFPLTKSELLKDREWLLNLKDRPKH